MNKILLIIKREYLSRVKKKSFLVVTFLVPVLFMGMISLVVYLTVNQSDFGDKKRIKVVDESGWFVNKLPETGNFSYAYTTDYERSKKAFLKEKFDYFLYIPADVSNIKLYGEKTPGALQKMKIENTLTNIAKAHRLAEAHIDSAVLASTQQELSVEGTNITEKGEEANHTEAAFAVGFACAFLIYISLFLYGAQVMRGVIEEKVNRIIEVVISSVKPFQLMLGKIIGVGMVGLTQFIMWIIVTMALSAVGGTFLAGAVKPGANPMPMAKGLPVANAQHLEKVADNNVVGFLHSLNSLPVGEIVVCFLFYFLFGYLLYSALFAAVGSAVDNETETQQFIIPITLPLIFTFMLAQTVIVNNPDSTLSIALSIIPFTAPIAMMIRIPFHVPPGQIAISMVCMVLGFLFTTWVAARVYRVGILMYGKKASYKEMARWFMYKE